MIKVQNLNKYYNKGRNNEIHVINDISLDLPNTGLIALLGQSGSGKTTLLNIIGGLDKATGTITYDEMVCTKYQMKKVDEYRKEHIGYVFQNYNLLTEKTVWENLELALDVIGLKDKMEIKKRIEYCLKAVGLYKYRRKAASALSGGQMQRVSIARALVKNSKIIIADEPTGNLDSDNSIEIMNILKKISKNSLVLLVTHDKKLAEYYADQIIEIVDGKVVNIRSSSKYASLETKKNDKNIYLKDLKLIEGGDQNLKYQIYLEEDIEKLEFTIIRQDNQLYLKSNQKLKLIDDTSLQLLDEHYVEPQKDDVIDGFDYDTSWYSEEKSQNIFPILFDSAKTAFKSFCQISKKTKVFYFAFILIGIIIGILNINYVNYSKVSDSSLVYDHDVYGIEEFDKIVEDERLQEYNNTIKEALNKGLINEVLVGNNGKHLYAEVFINSIINLRLSCIALKVPDSAISDVTPLVGRLSKTENEIVVTKKLIDRLVGSQEKIVDYSIFLNETIRSDYEYTIVGIIERDAIAFYYNVSNTEIFLNSANEDFSEMDDLVGYYQYEKDLYEVVYGEDLDPADEDGFLVAIGRRLPEEEYLELMNLYGEATDITVGSVTKTKTIRGIIYYEERSSNFPYFITNDRELIPHGMGKSITAFSDDLRQYTVVEGRTVENIFEGLAYAYSSYKIGDEVEGIKIVGKYMPTCHDEELESSSYVETMGKIIISPSTLLFLLCYYNSRSQNNILFTSSNVASLRNFFESRNFKMANTYEIAYTSQLKENQLNKYILIPIMILLIIVIVIYIYFSMRSKMINDIYSIGVYRSLGFSRTRLIIKNIFDILIITIFTCFLGYFLTSLLYEIIASKMILYGGDVVLIFDYWSTYALLFALIFVNIFLGIIPIVRLLQKTPSEIIAKYDI